MKKVISPIYLLDAVAEIILIGAWIAAVELTRDGGRSDRKRFRRRNREARLRVANHFERSEEEVKRALHL